MTKIVGIAGRKYAGKDAAANVLVEEHGYVNIKFADGIKDAARLFFQDLDYSVEDIERLVNGDLKETKLELLEGGNSGVFFEEYWDSYAIELAAILGLSLEAFLELDPPEFTGTTSREFQQFFGTEIGRNLVGEAVWTDAALLKAENYENVVISDVRFPNEVDAIRAKGGRLIRVNRDSDASSEFVNHPSEMHIDTLAVDVDIDNTHTLNDLYWSVLAASDELPDAFPYNVESNAAFLTSYESKAA